MTLPLPFSRAAAPVRVGIIGCGMVAAEYAATLALSSEVELHACADTDTNRAEEFARQRGIRALSVEDLLDPASTDLVVLLTPPATHAALAHDALTADVPAVWTEKPLALHPEEADDLLEAAGRADALLAAAPDTPLGPALLTAADALQRGLIGTLRSATATLISTGPERWHPAPEPFYSAGAGPLGDMGPYYLAALDQLLGPLHVIAATAHTRPVRRIRTGPRTGTTFTADAPTYIAALLETDDKTPVTLTASFDAAATRAPHIELHGTDATLVLPDPNFHHGDVLHRAYGSSTWNTLRTIDSPIPVGRGMGVLDLATALRNTRPPRCPPQRAARIAHLADAILRGTDDHRP